jgi:hypothetical protein
VSACQPFFANGNALTLLLSNPYSSGEVRDKHNHRCSDNNQADESPSRSTRQVALEFGSRFDVQTTATINVQAILISSGQTPLISRLSDSIVHWKVSDELKNILSTSPSCDLIFFTTDRAAIDAAICDKGSDPTPSETAAIE